MNRTVSLMKSYSNWIKSRVSEKYCWNYLKKKYDFKHVY